MNMIVAVDRNWGIGKDNKLLASVPGDMAFFKSMTMDKVVVMGRRTLESMPGKRGLRNRINYVLTRSTDFTAERCIVVHSEEELFSELAKYESDEVFLIGGASLYNKYYDRCEKLYVTKLQADLGADTFIVNLDEDERYAIADESELHEENGISYKFCTYIRK